MMAVGWWRAVSMLRIVEAAMPARSLSCTRVHAACSRALRTALQNSCKSVGKLSGAVIAAKGQEDVNARSARRLAEPQVAAVAAQHLLCEPQPHT